jgi:hypothetical protein
MSNRRVQLRGTLDKAESGLLWLNITGIKPTMKKLAANCSGDRLPYDERYARVKFISRTAPSDYVEYIDKEVLVTAHIHKYSFVSALAANRGELVNGCSIQAERIEFPPPGYSLSLIHI